MSDVKYAEKFWSRAPEMPLCQIADQVPGLYLFGKDLEGRHIIGNRRTLQRCGVERESELIGKTDFDFYPEELCIQYAEDDKRVIESGVPITELSELALNANGLIDWFITNKFPIFSVGGEVIGVIGTTIEYDNSYASYTNYSEIYPAIELLRERYTTNISLKQLADKVNLSTRQFQRKFKERFHLTVREYIVRLRIHKSCKLLANTDLSMIEISNEVGFYDQSAFNRQFKRFVHDTPLKYRVKRRDSMG